MKIINTVLLLILLFCSTLGLAQLPNFRSPLNIPIVLNGNFGELRNTHFHAGIDLKTNGVTGLPLFSIEDGFVSRISISPTGYGFALYIDHPTGHTSVYGHMERFAPEIASWVKKQQYAAKTFKIDTKPPKNLFEVKRGELIGYAGNSGSSGGPHLHFEIRNTATERPQNPLMFPFKVSDKTKPVLENLVVYPISNLSHIDNQTHRKTYKLVKSGNGFTISGNPKIKVYGEIGFGLDASDYLDGNWARCGIYKIELFKDSALYFQFTLDELDFYTNSDYYGHIDYAMKQTTGKRIHKCFIEHGNKLANYKGTRNRGIFLFDDGEPHQIEFKVYDVAGNMSKLAFTVVPGNPLDHPKPEFAEEFRYNQSNSFESDGCEIKVPKGALFSNLFFEFYIDYTYQGGYSPIYKIHNTNTPLRNSMKVSIRADKLPADLRDKAIIASIDPRTWKKTSMGGEFSWGYIETFTKFFGNFCIVVDTIPPSVIPLSIKEKKTLTEPNQIRFKIRDELTGIQTFNGYIDGNWVLFEYDAKSETIVYRFDENIKKGMKHDIELVVADAKKNTTRYIGTFYW